MRVTSTFFPSRVLFLLLLAALVAVGPALAAAPAATHAAPIDLASVLSTGAPGACSAAVAPAGAEFLQTAVNCTSDAQCAPLGKLCCRACAFPGCTLMRCLSPMNGHCPLIP